MTGKYSTGYKENENDFRVYFFIPTRCVPLKPEDLIMCT